MPRSNAARAASRCSGRAFSASRIRGRSAVFDALRRSVHTPDAVHELLPWCWNPARDQRRPAQAGSHPTRSLPNPRASERDPRRALRYGSLPSGSENTGLVSRESRGHARHRADGDTPRGTRRWTTTTATFRPHSADRRAGGAPHRLLSLEDLCYGTGSRRSVPGAGVPGPVATLRHRALGGRTGSGGGAVGTAQTRTSQRRRRSAGGNTRRAELDRHRCVRHPEAARALPVVETEVARGRGDVP